MKKQLTLKASSVHNLQGQSFQWVARSDNGHPFRAAIKVVMGIVSCLPWDVDEGTLKVTAYSYSLPDLRSGCFT